MMFDDDERYVPNENTVRIPVDAWREMNRAGSFTVRTALPDTSWRGGAAYVRNEVEWLAVRCCCQPTKVLGFMQLPRGQAKHSVWVQGHGLDVIEVRLMSDAKRTDDGTHAITTEMAIYSEDRGIEFWRGVTGFVEAAA